MSIELLVAVGVNLIAFAFGYGVLYQKVSSLDKRLFRLEDFFFNGRRPDR